MDQSAGLLCEEVLLHDGKHASQPQQGVGEEARQEVYGPDDLRLQDGEGVMRVARAAGGIVPVKEDD
eukprot:749729-Hanusia_phi.AAC.2